MTVLVSAFAVLAAAYFAPAAAAAPPPNDNFAAATVLGPSIAPPVAVQGTNAEATFEVGEPRHTGTPGDPHSSVWYRWTPTADVSAVLDLCDAASTPPGISYDFAIYTGDTFATLTRVAGGGGFVGSPGGCSIRFQANASTTYRIAVDSYQNPGFANFTLRLRQLAPPANDNYANAAVVDDPAIPVSVPATTIDANPEALEPAVLGGSLARSVWFKWTSGVSTQIRVDACNFVPRSGGSNEAIGVFTDTDDSLPANHIASSETCQVQFTPSVGQQYRIAFSGSSFGEGPFTLRIRSATPPSNDHFADALALGPALPISHQGNNDFATSESGEPATHGGGSNARSVWYTWTPTPSEAGLVAFNVCGHPYDTFRPTLELYTGTNFASPLVPRGTVPGGGSPYCYKLHTVNAGTPYKIAVSSEGAPGEEGDFLLDIHRPQPPANDAFAAAQEIGPTLPIAVGGTTVDATEQDAAGEPTHASVNDPLHSVWYRWTAPATEVVTIDACNAPFASAISVYTGSNLGTLSRVAQADDEGCSPGQSGSRTTLAATAGQFYSIAVDSLDPGYWGPFTLRIDGPPGMPVTPVSNPPSTEPAFNLKRAIKRCRKKFDKKSERKKRKKCIRKARKRARQD